MTSSSIVSMYDVKLITDERQAIQLLIESKSIDTSLCVRIVNHKINEFLFQSDIVYQYITMLIKLCRTASINNAIEITTTISYLLSKLFTHYQFAFKQLDIHVDCGNNPVVDVLRQIISNKTSTDEISTKRALVDLIKVQLGAYQYRELKYVDAVKKITASNIENHLNDIVTISMTFDDIFSEISDYAHVLI